MSRLGWPLAQTLAKVDISPPERHDTSRSINRPLIGEPIQKLDMTVGLRPIRNAPIRGAASSGPIYWVETGIKIGQVDDRSRTYFRTKQIRVRGHAFLPNSSLFYLLPGLSRRHKDIHICHLQGEPKEAFFEPAWLDDIGDNIIQSLQIDHIVMDGSFFEQELDNAGLS
jgi:hypothetical protein